MKQMKPSFYVMIALVSAALLYVIYSYNKMLEGFEDKRIMSNFQNMSPDSRLIVCQSLTDLITSYTAQMANATPEQKGDMQNDISSIQQQAKTLGC